MKLQFTCTAIHDETVQIPVPIKDEASGEVAGYKNKTVLGKSVRLEPVQGEDAYVPDRAHGWCVLATLTNEAAEQFVVGRSFTLEILPA